MVDGLETFVSVLAATPPLLILFLAGMGWLYRHEKERREAIERQLSDRKYQTYLSLIGIFLDVMKSVKAKKPIDESSITDRMFDVNKELVIYASDEVLETYQKWLIGARSGSASIGHFGDILVAVRRDMGNPKTKVTSEDVLRQFITDYDSLKAKGLA